MSRTATNAWSGTGTKWLANVTAGAYLTPIGSGVFYEIQTVDADGTLHTTANAAVDYSGVPYTIVTSFTPNYGFPYPDIGDVQTATILKRAINEIDSALADHEGRIDGSQSIFTARAAATGNVPVTNPGTATFDGITLTAGQILFLPSQTTGSQMGPWVFNGSAVALTRPNWFVTGQVSAGLKIYVQEGSTLAQSMYRLVTTGTINVGTTALDFDPDFGSQHEPESAVASATTCDIAAPGSLRVNVTGTTTITSFGTRPNVPLRIVRFSSALTLTYNATSLITLTGASRTTIAGDIAFYSSDASGHWRELYYSKSGGVGEATVASAATTDLGAANSTRINVTGTIGITSFGTKANVDLVIVRFSGALTITHNATSLVLLGGVSRQTTAGDIGFYASDASGHWVELAYSPAAAAAWSQPEKSLASAATTDLSTAPGYLVAITGSVSITSFGAGANKFRIVRFTGSPTLTHNATSLVLPGGVNIPVQANDSLVAASDASGNWRVIQYTSAGQGARISALSSPIEAMAEMVMNENAGMEVSQENSTNSITLTATNTLQRKYIVDGVMAAYRGSFVASAQQVADAPIGFNNSVKLTVGTAEASLGTNDELSLLVPIEGYQSSRLAFGTSTPNCLALFFWVKAHRAGSYSGSLRNGAQTQSYPFSFTINAADTWEYKTVFVKTGSTSGVWATDNSVGLYANICVAGGASRVSTSSIWVSSDRSGATGTVNGVAAITDVFQMTGFGVLPMVTGATFGDVPDQTHSPFLVRPLPKELLRAKRFYQDVCRAHGSLTAASFFMQKSTTISIDGSFQFYVPMRANPQLVSSSPAWPGGTPSGNEVNFYGNGGSAYISATGAVSTTTALITPDSIILRFGATSFGGTLGEVGNLYVGGSAWIACDARL